MDSELNFLFLVADGFDIFLTIRRRNLMVQRVIQRNRCLKIDRSSFVYPRDG